MKYVVIMNGLPGSGKTSIQKKCKYYLDMDEAFNCHSVSSIDYIKELYRQLGWDGTKTDKARKDLSILKQMWIDNCNGPLVHTLKFVLSLPDNEDHFVFVDVREESEIIKFTECFNAVECLGIKCTTVFVSRKDVSGIEYGNKSDDNIGKNMSLYRHTVYNDGDFYDLERLAKDLIIKILEDKQ